MLTPTAMPAKKNRLYAQILIVVTLTVVAAGCAPPGPGALLKGKKLLDRGDYAEAVSELKTATTLLATNAVAWDYYGVALQHAGELADAEAAYLNALHFDRDLVEAHYNLGCLYMEEDKYGEARTEFTAYTLRRSNTPEGWLKLGDAQLREGDDLLAERSFSTALSLSQDNAEALNGLGLARMHRGKTHDAAEFFAAAVQHHPDFGPALLNLATVEAEYLHDNHAALENYRKYLALTPPPGDADAVTALVRKLEQMPGAALSAPKPKPAQNATSVSLEPAPEPRVSRSETTAANTEPRENPPSEPRRYISNPPPEVVRVAPEQEVATAGQPGETEGAAPPGESRGMGYRLNPAQRFNSATGQEAYTDTGVTPLPPENGGPAAAAPPKPKIIPRAAPVFPRYLYLSPRKPGAGDRKAATRAFAQAQEDEQGRDLAGAMSLYEKATQLDPSWFEAQYNYGVLAYERGDYPRALMADEMALAIKPGSTEARYNFALALRSAGYVTDAERELGKVIAADPDNARAHLALGNLYAQQLEDPGRARTQYLKVLALDPGNPRAADIEFWLSANPP
ncbi:MAG TPA: tetratricopeptide repeat protein [Verrucomicrobiae bacterium]|nr:tetratricopeptide repeat protein [Verrucomicrobiae bacterium]